MADPITTQITYNLKFIQSHKVRTLLIAARDEIERLERDRLTEGLTAAGVFHWLEAEGFSLVPWQQKRRTELLDRG